MCIVFIHIVERPVSDIFSTCVFNNIMEVTFIFSPRDFSVSSQHDHSKLLYINGLQFFADLGQFR